MIARRAYDPYDLVRRHERLVRAYVRSVAHLETGPTLPAIARRYERAVRILDAMADSRSDLIVELVKAGAP